MLESSFTPKLSASYENAYYRLEFHELFQTLLGLCVSDLGRQALQQESFSSDLISVKEAQNDTEDALKVLEAKGKAPLSGLNSISSTLARLKSEATLSILELYQFMKFLQLTHKTYAFASEVKDKTEESLQKNLENNRFLTLLKKLYKTENLEKRLSSMFASPDALVDHASPKLYQIRTQIKNTQKKMRDQLEKLLKEKSKALQEQLITQRSGRYVLMVKESHRQQVPGIVHDYSSTGQTLFIEPLQSVEANNHIAQLQAEERYEIERILEEWSALLLQDVPFFESNQRILGQADALLAKALLAHKQKAVKVQLNKEDRVHLIKARHPFLDPKQVVPIHLELGKSFKVLLITGPNTGGKTVALKTLGLFSLMSQFGLLLPVSDSSEMALFDEILVDIGDNQNMEKNLSTFSSHIKNMIEFSALAGPHTLILTDEIGSGTDPLEGQALARALIEDWKLKGALVLATSHYRELKEYALLTEGVENASCAFDTEALKPKYTLNIGQMGISYAFAISQRLGLDTQLIEQAKGFLKEEDKVFEQLIADLAQEKEKLQMTLEQVEQEKEEAEQLKIKLELLLKEQEAKKKDMALKIREEARAKYAEKIEKMDALLEELKDLKKSHALQAKRNSHKYDLTRLEQEIGQDTLQHLIQSNASETSLIYKVGQNYYAPALQTLVRLESLPNNKGQCYVVRLDNSLRLKLDKAHLKAEKERPQAHKPEKMSLQEISMYQALKKSSLKTQGGNSGQGLQSMPLELMLIGQNSSDAIAMLDKYIDQAQTVGLQNIRIVHGKGTGVLRKAVSDFLKKDKRVESYELAPFGQGDSGATLAKLK